MLGYSARSIFIVVIGIIIICISCITEAKTEERSGKSLKINIVFDGPKDIKQKLDELAGNIQRTAKEFKTTSQVAYWDNEGKNLIQAIMHSKGYYNPIITSVIEEELDKHKQFKITFSLFPGEQYLLSEIEIIHAAESNKSIVLPRNDKLPTKLNTPANAELLIENESIILNQIEQNNCLLNLSIHNEATIDHRNNSVSIRYVVLAGPTAKIRSVDFKNTETVNKRFLYKVVSLEQDTCFKGSKIQKAQQKLQRTGLFAFVAPDIPDDVDQDGKVPVTFKLKERKHRSIKAGISYGKDLGLGMNAGWKHRNVFSEGEELSVDTFFNKQDRLGSIDYVDPYFLRDDQKLLGKLSIENTRNKAFNGRQGKLSLGLEREMMNNVDIGMSGKITVSKIKEKAEDIRIDRNRENFVLLSLPSYIRFDKRDSVLDARKGYYMQGWVEPFYDVNRQDNIFMKNILQARYYTKLNFHKESVIAVKARIGVIIGKNASDIPATERFYLGGSQSLRGYATHTVGPYDSNRKRPIGGKSFLEALFEYRFMREDDIGFAVFYDIGNVYRKHIPDYKNHKMFTSYGFGLRYNTDFGPIRADIGFPLNRRKGIDNKFQFSFGIGQTF